MIFYAQRASYVIGEMIFGAESYPKAVKYLRCNDIRQMGAIRVVQEL